jgi:hypothetical protein
MVKDNYLLNLSQARCFDSGIPTLINGITSMRVASRELKSLISRCGCGHYHSDECHKEYRFYNAHMNPNNTITAMQINTTNARNSRCARSDIMVNVE